MRWENWIFFTLITVFKCDIAATCACAHNTYTVYTETRMAFRSACHAKNTWNASSATETVVVAVADTSARDWSSNFNRVPLSNKIAFDEDQPRRMRWKTCKIMILCCILLLSCVLFFRCVSHWDGREKISLRNCLCVLLCEYQLRFPGNTAKKRAEEEKP